MTLNDPFNQTPPTAVEEFLQPTPTSKLAIAALASGCVGVPCCPVVVPSLLGVIFGCVALGSIKSGEVRGKGLAVGGIVTGGIGLAILAVLICIGLATPEATPVRGQQISASDRNAIGELVGLRADEQVEMFYATGMWSVREGGIVLTGERLIIYGGDAELQNCALSEIAGLEFTPAESWFDEGLFEIELDGGQELSFVIDGMEAGDQEFEKLLRRKATKLRESAGLPPPRRSLGQ